MHGTRQWSLHVHRNALSRPFYAQIFVPRCQRSFKLIILLIKATIPIVLLRVAYALFSSLALLKIIALVAPSILFTFFSIDSYHALKKV